MNFSHVQSAQQTQSRSLSPTLMKSLQLLSMPYPTLAGFLERLSLDNPFLEMESDELFCGERLDGFAAFDYEIGDSSGSAMDPTPLFYSSDPMGSLQEHLRLQLMSAAAEPELLRAGFAVIEYIDSRGYFCESLPDLAEAAQLPPALLKEALTLIQTFSPAGVGASGLKECLLLQADPERCDTTVLRTILEAPLEKLESRDLRYFAKLCGVSVRDVQAAFEYLATLSPFPGSAFEAQKPTYYIYPEIEVTVQNGKIGFTFRSGCELISINRTLFQEVSRDRMSDADTLEYVHKKYQEANLLMQELLLRRNAEEKLLLFLIQEQEEYFLLPNGRLKPITMRQAAAAIGMHPSTISRCVNGRYIQTKDGVIPLKKLFSTGLAHSSKADVSAVEVKKAIRAMIQSEAPDNPISDQVILERLNAAGIQLSRRTVAKYRDQLGIPGSRSRCRKGPHK